MKYLFLILVVHVLSFSFAQNKVEKEGWELTFNDEFNDGKLDSKKWKDHYYWGGRFNKGGFNYYGTEQLHFSDSSLIILAEKKKAPNGMDYVSGMIDCSISFKQKYGYFEIRSKNPTGTGFWPAFWLVTTEIWPPEIDIYEFYTNEPDKIHTTTHWLNKRKKKKMQPKTYKRKNASIGFHTYAVEWTEKKMIWYYDHKKIRTTRRGRKTMIHPMHIIINLEISEMKGMDLSKIILPNTLEVDYVRVYKRNQVQ